MTLHLDDPYGFSSASLSTLSTLSSWDYIHWIDPQTSEPHLIIYLLWHIWLYSLYPTPEVIQVWLPFFSFRAQDTLVFHFIQSPVATSCFGCAHVSWDCSKQFSPACEGRRWFFWPSLGGLKIRHLILVSSSYRWWRSLLPTVDEK